MRQEKIAAKISWDENSGNEIWSSEIERGENIIAEI